LFAACRLMLIYTVQQLTDQIPPVRSTS
jgi:hypothetical protein